MTVTGAIGAVCMFPLRAIINASVALGIHPNVLTLIGVLINVVAAWALAVGPVLAGGRDHDRRQHLRLHRRQGRAYHRQAVGSLARSGIRRSIAFPTSRSSPGLIWLYAELGRNDYVLIATLTLIFSIMTSYARARAECLIEKCKVGFMERPERIVLFMIGAFTDRMANVLWVILVLSIIAVANRIYYTYLALNQLADAVRHFRAVLLLARRARDAPLRHLGGRDPGSCGSCRPTGCAIRRPPAWVCWRICASAAPGQGASAHRRSASRSESGQSAYAFRHRSGSYPQAIRMKRESSRRYEDSLCRPWLGLGGR